MEKKKKWERKGENEKRKNEIEFLCLKK